MVFDLKKGNYVFNLDRGEKRPEIRPKGGLGKEKCVALLGRATEIAPKRKKEKAGFSLRMEKMDSELSTQREAIAG